MYRQLSLDYFDAEENLKNLMSVLEGLWSHKSEKIEKEKIYVSCPCIQVWLSNKVYDFLLNFPQLDAKVFRVP